MALCGRYAELVEAAANGVSVERAVFALIARDEPPLTPVQRDRLWKLFQTPIYAILTGRDGRIAGFECEAQDGFHLPGKRTSDAEAVCECGRPGAMLGSNALGMRANAESPRVPFQGAVRHRSNRADAWQRQPAGDGEQQRHVDRFRYLRGQHHLSLEIGRPRGSLIDMEPSGVNKSLPDVRMVESQ
jgi:hypothetical protein